jgi:tetratricopeptide (TPR) repeat protein
MSAEAEEHRPKRNPRPPRAPLHLAVAALLCGATFAIYLQVRHHDFVNYDDPIYIVENPSLQVGLSFDTVTRAFTEFYETNWIPLTWISFQIDHAFFGFEPAGYHLVNVALHALSAVLLYLVLARMTGAPWPSAFVAAVFAVHPLHVESVAWAAERKDTLSGVFWMLTLAAYGFYAARPRSFARYLLVAACFSLGLLAKPMLVTLPLVLLLLDYWPLGRLRRALPDPARLRRLLLEKLPLLAIAAAVSAITVAVQREAGAMSRDDPLTLSLRLMNALDSYAIYVFDSFWPNGLAIFYPHPMTASSPWNAGASALALVGTTLLFARFVASRPYLLVGWLWYLGTLVPVIGLVRVGMQARADRYMYIPQIGLTIALAWGARDALAHSRAGRVALAIAGAGAVAALSLCAWRQVPHWRDTTALYAHAIEVTEDNFLAHHGLAGELLEAGHPEEAEHHFARSVEIKPRWPGAHIGLADALLEQGRIEAAIESYRRALRLAPRHALGHAHLGKALEESGKLARGIRHYRRALELSGDDPMPEVHAYLAAALVKKNNLAQAEEHFERAIALRPGFGEAHANLGFVLMKAGRYAEARRRLERALDLTGESPEIHAGLATTADRLGDPRAAIRHYRAALRLRPGWNQPANNLAWLLATHPDPNLRDPEDAIRIAEPLCRDAGAPDPAVLDTLAAAYAAAGRFDAARRTAEAAVRLARDREMDALVAEIEQRLALYRAERPFIDATAAGGR